MWQLHFPRPLCFRIGTASLALYSVHIRSSLGKAQFLFKMNQQDPKKIPFIEDPAKELTSYATFTKSPYTSKFCDHFREDESVYKVEDEISKDKAVRIAKKIHVVKEDVQEGEGLIERKDLYTVCHNILGENGQNLRGYWEIEIEDTDQGTSLPWPVFQFGTLGLEIHPEEKGIIKSVQRFPQFS